MTLLAVIVTIGLAQTVPPVIMTQVPVHGTEAGRDLPSGSRIVSYDPSRPDQGALNLTGGFQAAGAPDMSFDGRRVLFVGRRAAGDPRDVWEMNVDGSSPRRITLQVGDCRQAVYLSTIYTIDDLEPTRQIAFCAGDVPALYTCRLDGTRVRRITFNPHGATDPYLLSDGRLLFSSWDGDGGSTLLTVNTDGTDVFVFTAAHQPPALRAMACEIDGDMETQAVYVEAVSKANSGGRLVNVSRRSGVHTPWVTGGDGLYHSPSSTGDGRLVVSYRAPDADSYGVRVIDPGSGDWSLVYDTAQWHELGAVIARARTVPAGRSSVVDDQATTGLLYCLDSSLTNLATTPDGSIESVQIFDAAAGGERLLATATVASDGSFYLNVPARTGLRLRTIDAQGEVLQSMRSWFWVMPGESRGCIGCHENRELTPPNRHALALRKPPQVVGPPEAAAP